jgi:regulator of sigma E protease
MVEDGRPGAKAGLKEKDIVVTIGDSVVTSQEQMRSIISANKAKPVPMTVLRNGRLEAVTVTPGEDGLIGVGLGVYPRKHVRYGLGESIATGFEETVSMTGSIFSGIGALVSGKAKITESVAGPAQIAKAAQRSAAEGAIPFLRLLVVISIGLACMNILPIPALDGGHLVFIIVEGVIRREVPLKIRMAIQNVGFVLLILLMAFVLYNDTSKLLGN